MLYVLNTDIHVWDHLPGKRCIRTLTSLSNELKTKLQRHTINAQASGPCEDLKWLNTSWTSSGNQQGYFSYLCKREANHEKFFILWIEENHYKEKGVGIVAEVLHKGGKETLGFTHKMMALEMEKIPSKEHKTVV
jgi:hypothetical protein